MTANNQTETHYRTRFHPGPPMLRVHSRTLGLVTNPDSKSKPITNQTFMTALIVIPMFAAAGYSLIYLLGGGGLFGAFVIFVVAKMLGK